MESSFQDFEKTGDWFSNISDLKQTKKKKNIINIINKQINKHYLLGVILPRLEKTGNWFSDSQDSKQTNQQTNIINKQINKHYLLGVILPRSEKTGNWFSNIKDWKQTNQHTYKQTNIINKQTNIINKQTNKQNLFGVILPRSENTGNWFSDIGDSFRILLKTQAPSIWNWKKLKLLICKFLHFDA